MRLLDLMCGAGGASMGYHNVGFEMVGVDIRLQPNYPFQFHQRGALAVLEWFLAFRDDPTTSDWPFGGRFDGIHASPPCQLYSKAQRIRNRQHPDLVGPTRDLLEQTGLPYVIENVPGAPLRNPVVLEGQMFEGLRTQRTRWFETNWPLEVPFLRSPRPAPNAKMGRKPREHEWLHVVGNMHSPGLARAAMGIDWMTRDELREAIPPAYTELIGAQLMEYLTQDGWRNHYDRYRLASPPEDVLDDDGEPIDRDDLDTRAEAAAEDRAEREREDRMFDRDDREEW